MNDLLVTEATKPNRRDLVKQLTEWRFWKLTLGCVLCVLLTLCAVGLFCWAINNRTQTRPDVDTVNNRTIRQSMCEQFEPGCKPDPEPSDPEPSDPEPSDPGSSDKGASPDGSSCERFEKDCPYNNPTDTKQPEEPKQPEVTETEAKSFLMNWMEMTRWNSSMFQWQNESAALPVVTETNWVMATDALAHIWPGMSKEKRSYVHWAKWVLQIAEETNWTMEANLPGHGQDIEIVKTNLQHPLLQNLDAAP